MKKSDRSEERMCKKKGNTPIEDEYEVWDLQEYL